MIFRDRREAGRLLAARLAPLASQNPLVLALPRGGVVVGWEVAKALGAPLDVLVARKLGAPGDPELALGAVAEGDTPETALALPGVAAAGIPESYVQEEVRAQLREVARRQEAYRRGRPPETIAGRAAVVVDDGVATGASLAAALRAARRAGPSRLIVAVPVAPEESLAELARLVDEAVCLACPRPFISVGAHYEDFRQTGDEEVVALLESARLKKW